MVEANAAVNMPAVRSLLQVEITGRREQDASFFLKLTRLHDLMTHLIEKKYEDFA